MLYRFYGCTFEWGELTLFERWLTNAAAKSFCSQMTLLVVRVLVLVGVVYLLALVPVQRLGHVV